MPKQDGGGSSRFRIFETSEFAKRMESSPANKYSFLSQKLREYVYPQLRENPFVGPNIKKRKGFVPDTWRYRVGDFRVFSAVNQREKSVLLLSVDDRRDAYR